MPVNVHDFAERLAFSEGVEDGKDLINAIANMVQNATGVRRATTLEDKHGTDYWIDRPDGLPPLSVDFKRRARCPIEQFGSDDACIETTSVYQSPDMRPPWRDDCRVKPGWTIDHKKRSDFIVYTWPADLGVRYWIVPFVPLCRAANINWRAWAHKYGERSAPNKQYLTLCVYPRRAEIVRAIRVLMVGVA